MIDYNTIYNKVEKLDLSKWILTRYFHYRSCVRDITHEYDEMFKPDKQGDPYIKELYYHFWEIYKAYTGMDEWSMPDNKTTIEIMNIETLEKLYITSYDCRYYLGTSYWSEFGSQTTFGKIDFNNNGKE